MLSRRIWERADHNGGAQGKYTGGHTGRRVRMQTESSSSSRDRGHRGCPGEGSTMASMQTIDEQKLMALLGKVVGDFGGAASIVLSALGDKLGLYRAMAEAGPVNSVELADRTGLSERYLREWLVNQASSGYVEYDATAERFHLSPEQALAFATDDSPAS